MQIIGCILSLTAAAAQSPITAEETAPVISYDQAADYIDRICYVHGRVVNTRNIGSRCFLNFHADFKNHFTVVINQRDFDKFPEPPEVKYLNQNVKVFGRVVEFNGKPEIVVSDPNRITILTEPYRGPTSLPASVKPAKRQFTGAVRIATYNLLNLFDGEDDPYHDDEGTPTKPRDAIEKVAATIRKIDADVLAVQEVENRFYLERVVQALLPDMGYREVVLFEGNDRRGIDVAILSRFPVGPVTSYRHLRFSDGNGVEMSFRRDLLQARIEPPGAEAFEMFVVHLKSKGGGADASLPIRMGEAGQLRKVLDSVLARDARARFVVCGDFNDTLDSEPMRTILGTGPAALRHLADELPEAERVSFNKAPYRSMIDFILASPGMARCYRKGSARILPGTVEDSGSDHNPVMATFDLR
ncbi:MAG: endonuclease/exonuclease/phosphatase family protein [Phycisphaerales bacterium]|nr:MAG: endonuclease/exonuclease/phosphatase family protein [Phycisphaerales bacterium]